MADPPAPIPGPYVLIPGPALEIAGLVVLIAVLAMQVLRSRVAIAWLFVSIPVEAV